MPTVPLCLLFLQARYFLVRDVTGAIYTAHKPKKGRRIDYFSLQARLRNLKAIELQAIRHGDKEKAKMVSTLRTITVLGSIWAIFCVRSYG